MKYFILLLVCQFATNSFAQQKVTLANSVSISAPISLKKISREDALTFAQNKFGVNNVVISGIKNNNADQMLSEGNVIVYLKTTDQIVNQDYLMHIKKGFDATATGSSYNSFIKSFNNYSVLIFHLTVDGVDLYNIFSVNNALNKVMTGRIVYNKSDQIIAQTILNTITGNINFSQ